MPQYPDHESIRMLCSSTDMNGLIALIADHNRIPGLRGLQEGVPYALQDQLLDETLPTLYIFMRHDDRHGAPGLQSEMI